MIQILLICIFFYLPLLIVFVTLPLLCELHVAISNPIPCTAALVMSRIRCWTPGVADSSPYLLVTICGQFQHVEMTRDAQTGNLQGQERVAELQIWEIGREDSEDLKFVRNYGQVGKKEKALEV